MKTLLSMIVMFVLSGCLGYRGGYSAPIAVPTMPSASAFPAAPVLPAVGSYGTGYYDVPPPLEEVGFVNGHGFPSRWVGPNLVKIKNTSDYYSRVRMDGREVLFFDQDVALPFLPPGQEAWLFIPFSEMGVGDSCEHHDFEFDGYLEADFYIEGNLGRPRARDRERTCFSPSFRGGSEIEISQLCFAGHC
jgi:hypothetical protein